MRGDFAIFGALVFRNVGIQQIELHASDVDVPDLDGNHAGWQLHRDHHVFAVFIPDRPHRKRVEIVDRVALLLPAIRIEGLLQVALLVQQTHADQRNGAIAGGLQVVAGKHAQSAAIDRHAFHQPVLHRKIRDQPVVGWLGAFQIAGIAVASPAIGRQKSGIRGRAFQRGLRHPSQHQDRIVAAIPPQRRIQPAEQGSDRVVPTPQHVVGKIAHASDGRRQRGPDKEFLNRLNLKGHGLTSDSQIYHRARAAPHFGRSFRLGRLHNQLHKLH